MCPPPLLLVCRNQLIWVDSRALWWRAAISRIISRDGLAFPAPVAPPSFLTTFCTFTPPFLKRGREAAPRCEVTL
jgi:hypothetical protein